MDVLHNEAPTQGMRISLSEAGREVAHAYLYIMRNDLHKEPFGFMEDIYVEEGCRDAGYGRIVLDEVIAQARSAGCYKLLGTSRHERTRVHQIYEHLGFKNRGLEFRIDFAGDAADIP